MAPETPRVRVYRDGRWWKADLRPFGGKRVSVRDPNAPGWPKHGERTMEKEVAERWSLHYLDRLRDKNRRRQLGYAEPGQRLEDAWLAFQRHREKQVSKNTLGTDRSALTHLKAHFSNPHVGSLDHEAMQAWVDGRLENGYDRDYIKTLLSSIGPFFRFLRVRPNPAHDLVLPGPVEKNPRWWTDEEIERLREAALYVDTMPHRNDWPSALLMLDLGLATGLRQEELYAAEWQNIDPVASTIRVRFQLDRDTLKFIPLKGKYSRTAVVMPASPFWTHYTAGRTGLILQRGNGRPVSDDAQRKLMGRILDAAKLNEMGVLYHSLRHTYARLFAEAGGWKDELQASLGHQSMKTTARYDSFFGDTPATLAADRMRRGGRVLQRRA